MILIKAVLSALPIFQCSLLLAPKYVTSQIAKLLRDFLWEGGKGNQKKMHLVSWEIIKRPISEGGSNIRDPELVNLALGGKLLWQIYSSKNHPVSKIFWKKYLNGIPMRNINSAISPSGTTIWNLCKRGLDNFHL